MSDDFDLNKAVAESKAEVNRRGLAVAAELRATASRIEEALDYLTADSVNGATHCAGEIGRAMRQPFGQNAQEFLLRDLANLSFWEGSRQAEKLH